MQKSYRNIMHNGNNTIHAYTIISMEKHKINNSLIKKIMQFLKIVLSGFIESIH